MPVCVRFASLSGWSRYGRVVSESGLSSTITVNLNMDLKFQSYGYGTVLCARMTPFTGKLYGATVYGRRSPVFLKIYCYIGLLLLQSRYFKFSWISSKFAYIATTFFSKFIKFILLLANIVTSTLNTCSVALNIDSTLISHAQLAWKWISVYE